RVRITTQRGRSAPAEGRDRVPSGTGSRKRLGYLVSLGSGLSSIDHLGEELVHPGLHGASPVDGALRTGLRQVLHRAPGQAAPAVGPAENVGGAETLSGIALGAKAVVNVLVRQEFPPFEVQAHLATERTPRVEGRFPRDLAWPHINCSRISQKIVLH